MSKGWIAIDCRFARDEWKGQELDKVKKMDWQRKTRRRRERRQHKHRRVICTDILFQNFSPVSGKFLHNCDILLDRKAWNGSKCVPFFLCPNDILTFQLQWSLPSEPSTRDRALEGVPRDWSAPGPNWGLSVHSLNSNPIYSFSFDLVLVVVLVT